MIVFRSSNSGIDGIAVVDGWERDGFPVFPLLPVGPFTRSS